jgi:hypothetical protein
MPPVNWPASIEELLDTASFQEEFGETTIRSETDIGPAKVRRRSTKGVDAIKCSVIANKDQYEDFRDFFDIDLNGGAGTFFFTNPITGIVDTYRMTRPPSISSLGGVQFSISMSWERLP